MKKRILKSWLVKVLGFILGSWFLFCTMTIDSLGDSAYNLLLIVWTILAIGSFYLLKNYSKTFE